MPRTLRPRPTVGVAAICVSDETSFDLIGLRARPFRDLLVRERIPHARHGRRVIARVDHVLAALDRLAAASSSDEPLPHPEPSLDVGSVDDVLARIGRRPTRGATT